ncbi:bifunctional 2-keto-4-hydroxyglutarate aldolase/2-keto-3-deoxy-6-phosphogluconate aldolase [Streptobacillus felis]|uniref:Bifunctional 2-keto-4-hydroxyglutarate aldolase/2-keto-3-deoxy-6-phosphogluconate aldolase n=1 Tax=Streptobacillus felis TaxID=1384509 RepID=A0A7Z0PE59_9FUSO|nr:bifunctional 2-keto-4-hydroxyglutarate aldolase/2-keto-3-deoxy-6-phosphogluconate aldolase [Streptobacillus felis]NYV27609.1 bifunctional 2-keto-4-hydroxyglutarate aldolase/2-keto-3-deoxy-6-phosphogluconate aldolase [Streptobacillus felis]
MSENILNKIEKEKLVAVIRGKDDLDAYEISKKVIEGGIKIIELTFSTPYVENTIERLSKENIEGVLVGAGTVLDDITARIAIMKGAKFIVSPHLDVEISKVCNRYKVPYLPGCATITEIVKALESGVELVKLFPGDLLGPNFIKNVKGPIPYAKMMPSGGVSIDNMDKWLESGAFALGIGSALTKNVKELGYESVKIETEKFYKKYIEVIDKSKS